VTSLDLHKGIFIRRVSKNPSMDSALLFTVEYSSSGVVSSVYTSQVLL
jgi:hypothetical protein